MVIQSSGAISLSNIQTEFGGSNPISISEYYNNSTTGYVSNISGIPTSGSAISISQFYGKQKGEPIDSFVEIYENNIRVRPIRIGTSNSYYYIFTNTYIYNNSSPINTLKFLQQNVTCTILVVGSGSTGGYTMDGGDMMTQAAGGAGGWIEEYTNYIMTQNITYYFFVAPAPRSFYDYGGLISYFSSTNTNPYLNFLNDNQYPYWDYFPRNSTICNIKKYNNTTLISSTNYETSFINNTDYGFFELGGSGASSATTSAYGGAGYNSNITGTTLEYSCGGNSTALNYAVPPFDYSRPEYRQPYWNTEVKTCSSNYGTGGSAKKWNDSVGQKQGCIIVRFNYP